jgi:hypothetical protein
LERTSLLLAARCQEATVRMLRRSNGTDVSPPPRDDFSPTSFATSSEIETDTDRAGKRQHRIRLVRRSWLFRAHDFD